MTEQAVEHGAGAIDEGERESPLLAGQAHIGQRQAQREEVITGFGVDVDPAAVGLPVITFARIRPVAGHLPKIAKLAADLAQVSECHRITGEDCFLVKVHAPSIAALESVLDKFLTYGQTVTSIVVSTPVPPRPLPVEGSAGRPTGQPTRCCRPGRGTRPAADQASRCPCRW